MTSESRESDYMSEGEQKKHDLKVKNNQVPYLSNSSTVHSETQHEEPPARPPFSLSAVLCWPVRRLNRYLDKLVSEEVEVDEIELIEYSSGESDFEKAVIISEKPFGEMVVDEKEDFAFKAWQQLFLKLRGAIYLI